jgi:hypothetical protein
MFSMLCIFDICSFNAFEHACSFDAMSSLDPTKQESEKKTKSQ